MAKTKKAPRLQKKSLDVQYTGDEVTWPEKEWTDEAFKLNLGHALNFYSYYHSTKDIRKHLDAYLKELAKTEELFTTAEYKAYRKTPDHLTPVTICSIARAHEIGMPLSEDFRTRILDAVRSAISRGGNIVDINVNKDAPKKQERTIHDRLRDIMNVHLTHFDILEDDMIDGKKVTPKSYNYSVKENIPHALIGKMIANIDVRRQEIQEAREGTCEQLNEGYSHFKATDFKRFDVFYSSIIEGLEQYQQYKKQTKKARVKKAPVKEKVVAKMRYCKEDSKNKLVSINPTNIIGASKLWTYNVKTRKLGCYVADDGGILGVKSTTIQGFDVTASVQKTLRKPEQQLKEFGKAGKVVLRTYLSKIKAVEIKLNGRINKDVVLLKVE